MGEGLGQRLAPVILVQPWIQFPGSSYDEDLHMEAQHMAGVWIEVMFGWITEPLPKPSSTTTTTTVSGTGIPGDSRECHSLLP